MEQFCADLDLIWANCLSYNAETSDIAKQANIMRHICLNLQTKFQLHARQNNSDEEMSEH